MDVDHNPEDLWSVLRSRWPEKACPFCGESDWVPIGVSRFDFGRAPSINEVLVVGCRVCGYEWLHSVDLIIRMGRKSKRMGTS